ncbi:MAG: DUF3667 domain-containing protein [Saprospiraceae bacterium]|nr:DUF3667 domain-containing protein [Saprospiraceae bacterium]
MIQQEVQLNDNCFHCHQPISGPFCAHCGRPQEVKRIDGKLILSEIASNFNLEKGFLFTVRELLIRPGVSLNRYIKQDRSLLAKPISFVIICSLVYLISVQLLPFEDGYINFDGLGQNYPTLNALMFWVTSNYGITNLLMAAFTALWLKLFFRKYAFTYFEILVALYFALGVQMLLFASFGLIEYIIRYKIVDKGGMLAIGYVCWAITRFFDPTKKFNYLKTLISYFLGMFSFLITMLIIGMTIDTILS